MIYPLAFTARAALAVDIEQHAARGKGDADRLCMLEGHHIKHLETEWLTLTPPELAELATQADAGVSAGFVQRYENAAGATVLAVTYWQITPDATEPDIAPEPEPQPEPDHTDDLYFRSGRTKKRRSGKKPDPNQMDLFGAPKD